MHFQLPIEELIQSEISTQLHTYVDEHVRKILQTEWSEYLATGTLQQWVQQEIQTALEHSPLTQAIDRSLSALQETRKELEQIRQQLAKLMPPSAPLASSSTPPTKWGNLFSKKWRVERTSIAQPNP